MFGHCAIVLTQQVSNMKHDYVIRPNVCVLTFAPSPNHIFDLENEADITLELKLKQPPKERVML